MDKRKLLTIIAASLIWRLFLLFVVLLLFMVIPDFIHEPELYRQDFDFLNDVFREWGLKD